MKLLHMEKVKDGKYLKNYELTYQNKAGHEKKYEIVSRHEISGPEAIGQMSAAFPLSLFTKKKCFCSGNFGWASTVSSTISVRA